MVVALSLQALAQAASWAGLVRPLHPRAPMRQRPAAELCKNCTRERYEMACQSDLLVFSHLRWEFVYQRPQQVLSRLARWRRVWFVEEPIQSDHATPFWRYATPAPGMTVCQPHTPLPETGFDNAQMPMLRAMMGEMIEAAQLRDYVTWYYTPMALPMAADLAPQAVVYDCMDELSGFADAPPQLKARERELLAVADVVFTGGPSLYRAKRAHHSNVHCVPSSVDVGHFAQAEAVTEEPADQAALPHPRLGFFGVIDERLDRDLLAEVARRRPNWSIIMLGPVVKIDPATLPAAPNLHYLGGKPYAELPAYVAGWDACLLPFARNDATQYISPTKTLEYMAAGKPIVSTPIRDVAEPYSEVVYLGEDAITFVAACEQSLSICEQEQSALRARMNQVLFHTSWDATAALMHEQLDRAIQQRSTAEVRTSVDERHETVIIGAGPTGLSAAYHYGSGALLLEKNDQVGGWCRSVHDRGFTFDMAGHIMFSKDPYVHELYEKLLGNNVHWQDREAWIYSKGVHTRYPFQGCLYGLPPNVIAECILGAIEARFGALDANGAACSALSSTSLHAEKENGRPEQPRQLTDCCADGVMEAEVELSQTRGGDGDRISPDRDNGDGKASRGEDFESFIFRVWGRGIARHFAIPYNRKLWAVPLKEMETSWLRDRVPMPDLEQMIRNALQPPEKPMGPNARFGYPLRGGFQALMEGFLPYIQNRLRLNTGVVRISPSRRTITTHDGQEIGYDSLISTMPLPTLIEMIGEEAPRAVRDAAAKLRFVSVRCVNLGVGRPNLTDKHWIYYPEDTVFHRIFVQGNASPHCNPPGGFGLTCEITYAPEKPLPCEGEALTQRCIEDCCRVGLIEPGDPIWAAHQTDLPHAYVVYDHARRQNVAIIRHWLAERDIVLAGRYSEWEYYNSDHAFVAGRRAAAEAAERCGAFVSPAK